MLGGPGGAQVGQRGLEAAVGCVPVEVLGGVDGGDGPGVAVPRAVTRPAALKFDDVDFLRRQLRVRRQVQRAGGGQIEIRLPKYGSERDVRLPDELLAVLSRHVDLGHRGDWLFAGGEDNPPHQNTVGYGGARRSLRRVRRASTCTTCGTSTPPD